MEIVQNNVLIESILNEWKSQLGSSYLGYKGHVYRMYNCCLALKKCDDQEQEKLAIAAAFHDIGLWSDHTVDYLPPSEKRAQEWLTRHDLAEWTNEINLMIDQHHKLSPDRHTGYPLVELFRRADLVDFSMGAVRFGLDRSFISHLKQQFPNAGFHMFLLKQAKNWFVKHPLSPPPFMKF